MAGKKLSRRDRIKKGIRKRLTGSDEPSTFISITEAIKEFMLKSLMM